MVQLVVEPQHGLDEGEVGERLREVAEQLTIGTDVLRVRTEVVRVRDNERQLVSTGAWRFAPEEALERGFSVGTRSALSSTTRLPRSSWATAVSSFCEARPEWARRRCSST